MLEDRIKVGQVDRLDTFHAAELGCGRSLLDEPGIHVIPSERRTRPAWGGYTVPVIAISTREGGVVSVRPDLVDRTRAALGLDERRRTNDQGRTPVDQDDPPSSFGVRPSSRASPLGAAEFDRLLHVSRAAVPYAYSLSGYVLYVDAERFRPRPSRAERLDRGDPRGADLRRRFDGEVFAVRSVRGDIASWAAIKLKSDDVWEIAVVTEPSYRGQGLAKEVVSAATAHILEQGRLALYVHDRTNVASAKVCRSLGYVEYAEEFFCEY